MFVFSLTATVAVLSFLSLVSQSCGDVDAVSFTFGACSTGKESCQECYQTLKKCLLGSDENVVNLSRAFYPPDTNPAEFVAVTYQYENINVSVREVVGMETWFWAESGSYLIHPLHVFSYMSLLFDKPEQYFAQTTHVTLTASCSGARREHMILLTHRLKTFVNKLTISGEIDDSYNAMVADRTELSRLLREENSRLTNILISIQVVMVSIVVALLVSVYLLHRYTTILPRNRCASKISSCSQVIDMYSIDISIAIVSFHILLYILSLDGVALHSRRYPPNEQISIIYHDGDPGDPFSVLYNLPLLVTIFDITVALFSFTTLVISLICCGFQCFKVRDDEILYSRQKWHLFLRLSSVGPVLAVLTHAPFIFIAYLNDGVHAGSIFVYYVVSVSTGFLLLRQAIFTCLSSVWVAKRLNRENTLTEIKVTLCKGTLKFKREECVHILQLAGGNLTLNCEKVCIKSRKLILSDSTTVKKGKLILSKNNNKVFKFNDEKVFIAEGNLQLQNCDFHHDGEADVDVEDGTKLKLIEGGWLKVTYNEVDNEHHLEIKDGKLVGKDISNFSKYLSTVHGSATFFSLVTVVIILLFLSLVTVLACYFILIPINKSISNAADRLIGVYHSLFVIVGAFFAHKTIFASKASDIQTAVKGRMKPLSGNDKNAGNARWKSLTDQEKLDEFYGIVVEIVAQHYTNLHTKNGTA